MKVYEFAQYSSDWWAVRRGVPTASEFSSIITPEKGQLSKQAHSYACQLVADLFDPYYGCHEDYQTAAMRNGTIMEPEARRFYAFDRGEDVRQVGFCTTDDGRFGCSPDGLVGDEGGLELKSPSPKVHVQYLLAGGVPAEYRPQVHGHLVVTGREWWDFMSYCRGFPPLLVRVVPDDYTAALRKALDGFWVQYQAMLASVRDMAGEVPPLGMPKVKQTPDPIFMA